jgi:hypothetical protein
MRPVTEIKLRSGCVPVPECSVILSHPRPTAISVVEEHGKTRDIIPVRSHGIIVDGVYIGPTSISSSFNQLGEFLFCYRYISNVPALR